MSPWTYYLFNFWGLCWERFGVAFCGQNSCYILFISIRFKFTLLSRPPPGFLVLVWTFCLLSSPPPFFFVPRSIFGYCVRRFIFRWTERFLLVASCFGSAFFFLSFFPSFLFGVMEEAGQEMAEGRWPFCRRQVGKYMGRTGKQRSEGNIQTLWICWCDMIMFIQGNWVLTRCFISCYNSWWLGWLSSVF